VKPKIAIVGRRNVGKSTLVNHIAGRRVSVVYSLSGTTRDRVCADISWGGKYFSLIDTGGFIPLPISPLEEKVRREIERAISEADKVLFLVSAPDGVVASDLEIADFIRSTGKPVILAVNKVDSPSQEKNILEFYDLGMGDPLPISAYHGRGMEDLLQRLTSDFAPSLPEPLDKTRVIITGRPNVGKSTLFNAILGEERSIVDDTPGTTRDAIVVSKEYEDGLLALVDSVGIRRRGKRRGVERQGVSSSLRNIQGSHVAILMVDATSFITQQDKHIAGAIRDVGCGIIVAVNKWDLISNGDEIEWEEEIRRNLRFVPYAALLFISALTGYNVNKILPRATEIYKQRFRQLTIDEVREVVEKMEHPQKSNIISAFQSKVDPPTFVFHMKDVNSVHFSFKRYVENRLREAFGFEGVPLRLMFT
jgi:GTP-binding protein